jgi:EAL domain-containing protein (putative c-di-GMP-specific phosphodiesterase class I)/FixJ family two-component response regulator
LIEWCGELSPVWTRDRFHDSEEPEVQGEIKMTQSILIIDDDSDLGEIVCATAQDIGWQAKATTNVPEFLDCLTPQTTLIFLDLMMPQTDGIELLRLLAQQQCSAGIVLMSGVGKRLLDTAEELAEALGMRIVGHLQKPFRIDQVEALLNRSQMPSARRRTSGIRQPQIIPNADLRNAIKRNEFILHYQPQIDMKTEEVVGLEALVRWQRPEKGLTFPDMFIPRIEAMGWIDDLGWLVAKRALSEIEQFADKHGNIPSISINTSVRSLLNLSFPDTLVTLALKFNVPPEKITIEVTESGLLKELSMTLDVLTRLRMKGVNISIDDFGTGYSMMQQLRRIPATELKIDKSFVRNMHDNDADRVIVQKTIEIGHELGMKVVVEGVETAEQMEFLRASGCDVAQGYLFTRPLSISDLQHWLHEYSLSRLL